MSAAGAKRPNHPAISFTEARSEREARVVRPQPDRPDGPGTPMSAAGAKRPNRLANFFFDSALRKRSFRCPPEGDPSPQTKEQPRWPQ